MAFQNMGLQKQNQPKPSMRTNIKRIISPLSLLFHCGNARIVTNRRKKMPLCSTMKKLTTNWTTIRKVTEMRWRFIQWEGNDDARRISMQSLRLNNQHKLGKTDKTQRRILLLGTAGCNNLHICEWLRVEDASRNLLFEAPLSAGATLNGVPQ